MPRSGVGKLNGGCELNIEVGDLECEWRLGREVLFWGRFVVMGTGQQRSEGGERKQEGEDQRPTASRKKEALTARELRLGGLTPLPAVAHHSLPPSPQGFEGGFVVLGTEQQQSGEHTLG